MASQQSHNLSQSAGEAVGQAQMKKDEIIDQASRSAHDQSADNQNASITTQATTFIQQTGEQVKNMAQGAAEAVKNSLGMNENTATNNSNNPGNNPAGNNCSNPTSNPSNNPTTNISNNPTTNPSSDSRVI